MSTLTDLLNYGQSYWLDNLARKKITNGELQRRVSEQGLRGITSNPSIFNKAIWAVPIMTSISANWLSRDFPFKRFTRCLP